ncbi:DUF4185 domain-containing protein [Rhodococcus sp. D2-41]|uniref:DUF4185 domain-containing protein n=1 Tax=Speluncibacter jeojiensis TaxID=2710754 RepID=UPI0038553213|nr:DUF4185 domain-containing protein [Rhodococcus sp. D2-41]
MGEPVKRVGSVLLSAVAAATITVVGMGATTASADPYGINPIPIINGMPLGLPQFTAPSDAQVISYFTGLESPNNTTQRFNVLGTDLGIMWDNGAGQVLTAFGDTFGFGLDGMLHDGIGDWRSNVLFRSNDHNLAAGMTIASSPEDRPGHSKELIHSRKIPGIENTVVPTAGVAVNGVQYMRMMSVRLWGAPGEWQTNRSMLAYSTDNGENWQLDGRLDRPNSGPFANFQMSSFVKDGGYVYEFGTPEGRQGDARLARVPEAQIRDMGAYEYWDGHNWIKGKPEVAAVVIPGPVSEMSVQYNSYLGQYLAMYTQNASLVLRQSPSLTGPWSPPRVLVPANAMPGLYGGFMHPWSSGPNLYFLATDFPRYNVMLMHTTLRK